MPFGVTLPDSIEPDQVKTAAIVAIAALAVLAFLVMRFIQKLILKLLIVAALVGTAGVLYTQRDDLAECQARLRASFGQDCVCGFAGFDVTVPGCESLRPSAGG